MLKRLRTRASHIALALSAVGLVSSGPVQALETPAVAPLAELNEVVAGLEDPLPGTVSETYEAIGGGEASYYGHELAGNRTASGERFNPAALTAAHRTLPLGTRLRVTNRANGKSVVVRVNDRGPFVRNRIIDVSLAAAREIGMIRSGKAMVTLERLV
jgi:rare lipoprotein A